MRDSCYPRSQHGYGCAAVQSLDSCFRAACEHCAVLFCNAAAAAFFGCASSKHLSTLLTAQMLKWSLTDGMLQVSAQVPELCVLFHESVQALSKHFLAKERRHVYITPTSYLELIHSYKTLLSKKQNEVGRVLIHASCSMHMFLLQEAQHVLLSTTLVWCKQAW